MNATNDGLRKLFERMRGGVPPTGQQRAQLEANLTPLVRRVVRTGLGPPALVAWVDQVRSTMAASGVGTGLSPEQESGYIGRLLCSTLIDRAEAHAEDAAARETVVGW